MRISPLYPHGRQTLGARRSVAAIAPRHAAQQIADPKGLGAFSTYYCKRLIVVPSDNVKGEEERKANPAD